MSHQAERLVPARGLGDGDVPLSLGIEGSTRLWEEHPVAMRSALARHDEILLAAIDAHDGYVFATGGDGFAAAFHTPEDAVKAAGAAQVALSAEEERSAVDIRVRMGIHTGSADERNGDYFGHAPTRTARIIGVIRRQFGPNDARFLSNVLTSGAWSTPRSN